VCGLCCHKNPCTRTCFGHAQATCGVHRLPVACTGYLGHAQATWGVHRLPGACTGYLWHAQATWGVHRLPGECTGYLGRAQATWGMQETSVLVIAVQAWDVLLHRRSHMLHGLHLYGALAVWQIVGHLLYVAF